MEYRHTQQGTVVLASVGAIVFLIIALSLNRGSIHPVEAMVAVLLVLVLLQFSSLTVEVRDGGISCRFGPGLIRKWIPLSDIDALRSVTNPWIAGWGIRWLPGHYWLWNVSGLHAVELQLRDGSRFRIGTDEPDILVDAIKSHRAQELREHASHPSQENERHGRGRAG
jgi:hypothetical protein